MRPQALIIWCFGLAVWLFCTPTLGAQVPEKPTPVSASGSQTDDEPVDSEASTAESAQAQGSNDGGAEHAPEAVVEDSAAAATPTDLAGEGEPIGADTAGFDLDAPVGWDVPAQADTPPAGEEEELDSSVGGAEAELRTQRTLHAGSSSSEFRLDGRLNELAWSRADSIHNLTTVEPVEGGIPAGQTTAKVLVTPREIIIGVMCYDKDPSRIVSYSKARDALLDEEDHVMIVLDPFQDGRSGYVFAVNPSGARFDGLVFARGKEVNSNWDAVWEAKTWRGAAGWSTELRIPISSLSFRRGVKDWGFNLQRRVQRLQETSRWSGASLDYELFQTSRAGVLTNLPDLRYGLGLSIRPALVGGANRLGPDLDRDYTGDLSLDVTQKVGPNLVASATVNTDFAETEVDARQTNLTRFDLFFPEKRTFFLEGSDIFEFGVGMDEEIFVPFHTRQIGLSGQEDDQLQIPINVGGKLNGRMGNTSVGALAVRTGHVDSLGLPNATMGAVRLKQDVLAESSVGLLATFGDPLGRSGSWMAGADLTYQTSEFMGEKNLLIGVWGLGNDRVGLTGNKFAYGAQIAFPNDLFDIAATYKRLGDGFQPSLGFVPRTGQFIEVGGEINPRPRWPFLRQMIHELSYAAVLDERNVIESHRFTIKPLDWLLESGDRFDFQILPEGERLTQPFDIADDVLIPTGSYRWVRYSAGATLAAKRPVSGLAIYSFGDFYEGTLSSLEFSVAFKPWSALTLELGGERNSAQLPQGDFVEELYSGRVELKYSSDLQLSSLLQYDTESESFGSNTRLRWTFNDRFSFDSNQLLVKVQYALRL
jgi:uncharacterized protein DUF5916